MGVVGPAMPALATTTSAPPNRSRTAAVMASVEAGSDTSQGTPRHSAPSASSSPTARPRESVSREQRASRAPAAAMARAMASPIPRLPPVTTATLPSRVFIPPTLTLPRKPGVPTKSRWRGADFVGWEGGRNERGDAQPMGVLRAVGVQEGKTVSQALLDRGVALHDGEAAEDLHGGEADPHGHVGGE